MVLTARGAALCGAGVALAVLGVLREDGVLSALGLAGLFLLGGALVVGKWNLRGLGGELKLPDRVFADAVFMGNFRLRQEGPGRDRFAIRARLRLAEEGKIEARSAWIPADGGTASPLEGRFPKRGIFARHPYELASSFPMGLWEQKTAGAARRRVIVFPKAVVPREFFESGRFEDWWEGAGGLASLEPGEFHGLRGYRAGDPARLIHWGASARSLARGRGPWIRENEPPAFRPEKVTVIFHSHGGNKAMIHGEAFERGISLLCGTLRHLRGLRVAVTFRADFADWEPFSVASPQAWGKVLEALAGANRATGTEEHELRRIFSEVPAEDGMIVLSDMPEENWRELVRPGALVIDLDQAGNRRRKLTVARRKVI